jgi:peptide/nickel transport system permease protein
MPGATDVEAARVIGLAPFRIFWRHVLPGVSLPLPICVTTLLGGAILFEDALSSLALGVPPPNPSWGRMLVESRDYWQHTHLSTFPGLPIALAVLGFNLFGDSLRDIIDPASAAATELSRIGQSPPTWTTGVTTTNIGVARPGRSFVEYD